VRRLKLIVAYNGASWAGWQSQSHRNTIQDRLEQAFTQVNGKPARVHGAGRTDAGVHALGQCAHVDLAKDTLSPARWMEAVNALLPPTIRVLRCQYVPEDFHARFSAKGKIYRYRIWSAAVLPPLEYQRAWHVSGPLDPEALKTAARLFVGTHDFAGFAANRGKRERDTIRTIHSIHLRRNGHCLTIDFDGSGFLYKMVRLMVGELVRYALGKADVKEISDRLNSGRVGSARFAAPAEGLFLVRVRY
jgi:tRNA pseudouridine38-40 synthase